MSEHSDSPDDELADVDIGYRQRGRPRLSGELRRKEKLVISLTVDELRQIMIKAASELPFPLSPNDWARQEILKLSSPLGDRGSDQ